MCRRNPDVLSTMWNFYLEQIFYKIYKIKNLSKIAAIKIEI